MSLLRINPDYNVPHVRIEDEAVIQGTYSFGEKLGKGTFGTVIGGTHVKTKKKFAIKKVNKEKAGNFTKMLEREIAILKMVNHQNIIQLIEVYESPQKVYLVTEFCEFGELKKILEQKKCMNEYETKHIIASLADAVAYLHKNGIVHRDLKLENILVKGSTPDERGVKLHIKVTDFGLSVVREGCGSESLLQDACGTPLYMAPEIHGRYDYSHQCDVWSIGIIMYTLLRGQLPFSATREEELSEEIKKGELDLSHPQLDFISDSGREVLEGLLSVNPAHRFTASELLDHHWITGDNRSKNRPKNVLEMMKLWKEDLSYVNNSHLVEMNGTSKEEEVDTKASNDAGSEPQKVLSTVEKLTGTNRMNRIPSSDSIKNSVNYASKQVLPRNARHMETAITPRKPSKTKL
ncbi:serine/threonine-protein kinase 33-like [Protopterus annectens]|uniref:serine/threonine-protein kinase 33-like n=1 Tax=Protopterus annectens TaxID=7888 RepID=UPI001CFAE5C0|nr:serine/threonine-protein kinase 33-like [Protopterus annectens]